MDPTASLVWWLVLVSSGGIAIMPSPYTKAAHCEAAGRAAMIHAPTVTAFCIPTETRSDTQ